MHRAAAALGVTSFGISIEEFGPGGDEYPEHDHADQLLGSPGEHLAADAVIGRSAALREAPTIRVARRSAAPRF
jgi:hypothetical protein